MSDNEASENQAPSPSLHVAPSPHVGNSRFSTRGMMLDVIIGLLPLIGVSFWVFGRYALLQLGVCLAFCLLSEFVFTKMRGKKNSLSDLSAVVTALILALSLPWTAPWYVGAIASVVAIGMGKIMFGGLGQNIFNPAMVGRAFVMICFPAALGASAYICQEATCEILTGATPLTMAKNQNQAPVLLELFLGNTNGSLGETSALACLIGGSYLLIRGVITWEIPVVTLVVTALMAAIFELAGVGGQLGVTGHLIGGALLYGAFFIATDLVTSPLTSRGKVIFAAGLGFLIVIIRECSGYPEGLMFAVLIMNSVVPLINRWTIPVPLGGKALQARN